LDADFIDILDDISEMLRQLYGTKDGLAIAVSGSGMAGMEAGLSNLLEPGDTIVIGVNGFFAERMVDIASRQGATPATVQAEWGHLVDPSDVAKELAKHRKVKALAVVHAETSTGVLQPLEDLAQLARSHDALFLVDAVTSLGGSPLVFDQTGIDFCYSAGQKCIGTPPGVAPIAVSPKALRAIESRNVKPHSWYFDISLLRQYWQGATRVYHHTPPNVLLYSLREALRLLLKEGLEERWERHRRHGHALRVGLEALGLRLVVPEEHCIHHLTLVEVPDGVDDAKVRGALRREYNIEIGGGLGKFRGKVWRIGLMGYSSSPASLLFLLSALETLLPRFGFEVSPGAGVAAAGRSLVWASQ